MKTLQEIILEKLKIRKRTTEILSKEQLDILFIYCMCYLGDKDLYEESIDSNNTINWGEMERYSQYNIDWYDNEHNWISDYGCDNYEKHTDILNLMDNFGESVVLLFTVINEYYDTNPDNYKYSYKTKHNMLKAFLFYIMEYINCESSNIIDLNILNTTTTKINTHKIINNYKTLVSWSDLIKDTKIIDACQKVYDAALELINK